MGDLGFVEMTQALVLAEVQWRQVGPDLMLTGYLPQSGGLRALAATAAAADGSSSTSSSSSSDDDRAAAGGVAAAAAADGGGSRGAAWPLGARLDAPGMAQFYKAWDRYGALSNFSPHPIAMPGGTMTSERLQQAPQEAQQGGGSSDGSLPPGWRRWPSMEHYYQSQKVAGVAHPDAAALVEAIAAAGSPEEAARLGRGAQRQRPDLMRPDWDAAKVPVMLAALRAKFAQHAAPRAMLLATARNCGGRGAATPRAAAWARPRQPTHAAQAGWSWWSRALTISSGAAATTAAAQTCWAGC